MAGSFATWGLDANNTDWTQLGGAQPAVSGSGSSLGTPAGAPMPFPSEGSDRPDSSAPASQKDTGAYNENRGYIDLGPGGRMAMTALGMMPGPLGMIAGAANMGMRANNVGVVNDVRAQLGMGQLSFGQTVGAMLGLNDYGKTGYVGDLDIGGNKYGVSIGGMLGEKVGLTPAEAQARQAHNSMASRGMYGGTSSPQGFGSVGSAEPGFNSGNIGNFGSEGGGTIGNDATTSGTGSQAAGGGYSGDADRDSSMYADGGSVRDYELMDLIRQGGQRPPEVPPRDWERLLKEVTGKSAYGLYADGGSPAGGYVIPAYVPSALGLGSTEAGAKELKQKLGGGELIRGPGHGRSDDIKRGNIRVSNGEFFVPPEIVEANGGPDALKRLVMKTKSNYMKTLGSLPGPKE